MNILAQQILDKLTPHFEKSSKSWWMLLIGLGLVVAAGLYALVIMLIEGHIVTGMRDYVPWGVFITNFIYLLGFAYAGALLTALLHLTKISWMDPAKRILEMMTVFTIFLGPLYIFLCVGRLDRVHHLFIYSKIQSPMTWDKLAIITCMVFFLVYVFVSHVSDFALLRDNKDIKVAKWKRSLYTFFAINYRATESQKKLLDQSQNILAAIIVPAAIIAYSLLAWLFGMNLRPGWHSSIFAPHFIVTAVYSVVALVLVILWVYRKTFSLDGLIKDRLFYYIGFALLVMTFVFGYFSFSEFITDWYNLDETHETWLMKFMDMEQYGVMNIIMIFFTMFFPIIIMVIPSIRNINTISIAAFMVLVGLWLKRYLLIVPTLETPYIPMQDIRPEYAQYSATWIEWVLSAAGIAAFIILYMLYNKFLPILPVSDAYPDKKANVPSPFYKSYQKAK